MSAAVSMVTHSVTLSTVVLASAALRGRFEPPSGRGDLSKIVAMKAITSSCHALSASSITNLDEFRLQN